MIDPLFSVSYGLIEESIKSYLKLRRAHQQAELDSDEWIKLEKSYLEHLQWRFDYPARTFRRQAISGIIITVLVLVMIIAGLVFSFIQLNYAIKSGDISSLQSELSAETAGKISISSSIIGAVVLVISLAFFYLYLGHVFKIQYPTPPHVKLEETGVMSLLKNRGKGKDSKLTLDHMIKAIEAEKLEQLATDDSPPSTEPAA